VPSTLRTELVEGGVLVCTLDRPDRLNALTRTSLEELAALWRRIEDDEEVRAVLVTGAGRAFCAGGDVSGMTGPDLDIAGLALGRLTTDVWRALGALTRPVVAAVNGDAVGAGLFIPVLADFVVAAEHARFGDPHVRLGLVASGGGALVASLGVHHAKELLLSGDLVDAGRAREMGLVGAVCPAGEVMALALARARQLAALPHEAVRWTKRCLNRHVDEAWSLTWDAELALEAISATRSAHATAVEGFGRAGCGSA
ncbi:MAG: enoyl-CoA hydratase/isomerase family protein, partial [Acidimicrobiia bacterium]